MPYLLLVIAWILVPTSLAAGRQASSDSKALESHAPAAEFRYDLEKPHIGRPLAPQKSFPVLIKELGSEIYKTRQAASRELKVRGESAIPILKQAATEGEAEVRERAKEILDDLAAPSIVNFRDYGKRRLHSLKEQNLRKGWAIQGCRDIEEMLKGKPLNERSPRAKVALSASLARAEKSFKEWQLIENILKPRREELQDLQTQAQNLLPKVPQALENSISSLLQQIRIYEEKQKELMQEYAQAGGAVAEALGTNSAGVAAAGFGFVPKPDHDGILIGSPQDEKDFIRVPFVEGLPEKTRRYPSFPEVPVKFDFDAPVSSLTKYEMVFAPRLTLDLKSKKCHASLVYIGLRPDDEVPVEILQALYETFVTEDHSQ